MVETPHPILFTPGNAVRPAVRPGLYGGPRVLAGYRAGGTAGPDHRRSRRPVRPP